MDSEVPSLSLGWSPQHVKEAFSAFSGATQFFEVTATHFWGSLQQGQRTELQNQTNQISGASSTVFRVACSKLANNTRLRIILRRVLGTCRRHQNSGPNFRDWS